MDDLKRLITLLKYFSDHQDTTGINTLRDVVIDKVSFDEVVSSLEDAHEGAFYLLNTLYDIEFNDGIVLGQPKLSMKRLFYDLVLLIERCEIFLEEYAEEQLDA